MEKMHFNNNTVLVKMEVAEYDKEYNANYAQKYNCTHIFWVDIFDDDGECIGGSTEGALMYADNTYAYTDRGIAFKCTFAEAMQWIMFTETTA